MIRVGLPRTPNRRVSSEAAWPVRDAYGQPAYLNARPRLRQSDIRTEQPAEPKGFWRKIVGRG